MSFTNVSFLLFFVVVCCINFSLQKSYRYLWLLLMSILFYLLNDHKMVVVLLIAIGITYIGGIVIAKKPTKLNFAIFFCLNIAILLVYKYTNFIIANINVCMNIVQSTSEPIQYKNFLIPIGLSFYIFQSTSYLGDIYRYGENPEKNLFKYALFVSFFPTVLSGPIQKSREFICQINNPKDFDYERAKVGFCLFIWGYFEKIVVANRLAYIVNTVYDNFKDYDGIYYLIAAICFSLYIYSDFSSYSDMACGIAKIIGFDIRRNFRNPYLSETIADFWKRWHMSLNSWFVEYIYVPLGGSKKGVFRKYLNTMVVFLLSGAWHGASWHFICWGGNEWFISNSR